MDGMVKYTHHQVQQLGPALIKPASNKSMENNKKGANVSVSLCTEGVEWLERVNAHRDTQVISQTTIIQGPHT